MKKLHALVLGATGATGRELVKLLLNDSNFSQVSVFVRTVNDFNHEKLTVHKIDFKKLNEYDSLVKGDVLFSALGTTMKEAGGKKEQFLVDYIYQYEFAKIASKIILLMEMAVKTALVTGSTRGVGKELVKMGCQH